MSKDSKTDSFLMPFIIGIALGIIAKLVDTP